MVATVPACRSSCHVCPGASLQIVLVKGRTQVDVTSRPRVRTLLPPLPCLRPPARGPTCGEGAEGTLRQLPVEALTESAHDNGERPVHRTHVTGGIGILYTDPNPWIQPSWPLADKASWPIRSVCAQTSHSVHVLCCVWMFTCCTVLYVHSRWWQLAPTLQATTGGDEPLEIPPGSTCARAWPRRRSPPGTALLSLSQCTVHTTMVQEDPGPRRSPPRNATEASDTEHWAGSSVALKV